MRRADSCGRDAALRQITFDSCSAKSLLFLFFATRVIPYSVSARSRAKRRRDLRNTSSARRRVPAGGEIALLSTVQCPQLTKLAREAIACTLLRRRRSTSAFFTAR